MKGRDESKHHPITDEKGTELRTLCFVRHGAELPVFHEVIRIDWTLDMPTRWSVLYRLQLSPTLASIRTACISAA